MSGKESPDSLRSTSYARMIDVLSEGQIQGLVNGLCSVYLDETPIKNSDGSFNFSGYSLNMRSGSQSQDYVSGFSAAESTTSVGVEVKEATPVVRTISDATVDEVLVTIGIPLLQRTDKDDGDVTGTKVRMRVEVQPSGGSWYSVGTASSRLDLTPSANGVSTGSDTSAISADVTLTWGRTVTDYGSLLYSSFTVQYRQLPSGSWTTWKSGTITLDATSGPNNSAPSYRRAAETFSASLPGGSAYEWRVINTSGDGTFTLSGTYTTKAQEIVFDGKCSSRYQRQIRCPLTGSAPWNIRVTRMSDDSTSSYLQNQSWWDSYTEVVNSKLRYPLTAYAALSIDAKQFSSIPSRAYDIRGLIVQVPANYDPLTRAYTGSWDGTFKMAWTDNPAWCFYDLLTHPRYGLGDYVGTGVDKWALYSIAQYCDQLVPDGFGGSEPRFRCNLYLGSRQEAYRVVQDMAAIFRAMIYWAAGSITTSQDSPADPVALYAPANVVDGMFTYSGTAGKARHTVALVTWNDPANLCKQAVEYVEDRAGIARFGYVPTEVAAVGCTSRGQAHRVGKWLLYSERLESETVTFRCGLDTAPRRPGQIIAVADPGRAGVRLGGRLLGTPTTTSLTLDAPVTLTAGVTYTLSCLKADGTVQESTITTAAGTVSAVTVSPALAEAPAGGSLWIITSSEVDSQLFRVIAVTEVERNVFEVTALAHDPSKYDAIELDLALEVRNVSSLSERPDSPQNLAVTEALYARGTNLLTRLDVSWSPVSGANAYTISWRRSDGTRQPALTVYEVGLEIDAAAEGQVYDIEVYAQNALGLQSSLPAELSHTVLGKSAPPSNVQGFVVARAGDILNFSWRPITDLDASRYEIRRGDAWETSIVVANAPHPTNYASVSAPRGGTFMIKAVDTSGNYSDQATEIIAADVSGINVVLSFDDGDGGFNGTFDSTYEYVTSSSPSWGATSTWASAGTWDVFSVRRGVTLTPSEQSGTYISETVDIGYVASSLVTVDANVEVLGPLSYPWVNYTQPWSYYSGSTWVWQPADGAVGASYEISTSLDGIAWSDWATFTTGGYQFRYMRLRVTLTTQDPLFRPYMTRLTINVDVPDRVEHFADVAVPAAGATITFSPAFVGVATAQCTLQSASVGDTVKVTAKSASSVTVQVFNSAGTAKSAVVDVDVFGYGERYS